MITDLAVGSFSSSALKPSPRAGATPRRGNRFVETWVAGRRGVDLSGHRSRGLTRDLLTDVSLAVGMSDAHLQAVRHLAPDVPAVLATELLPDGDGRRGSPVPDPFGGDEERYDEVADVLQSCVDGMLDRMSDE